MNNIIFLVLKKELKDIFRDRKAVISGILIPLLLFPIVFGLMGNTMKGINEKLEKNLEIAIVDEGNSSLKEFIKKQSGVKLKQSKDIYEDIKSGKILLAIEIPKDLDTNIDNENVNNVKIIYDNSSNNAEMALSRIKSFIELYSKEIVSKRLIARNIDINILNPIEIEEKTISDAGEGFAKQMLSLLFPMMILLYSATGTIPAASDLGAGEKERGTLEPLLTTQAGRMSLLWGKFLSITVFGLITTVFSMIGLVISMNQSGGLFDASSMGIEGGIAPSLDTKTFLIIGLIGILTTMMFGALELAISIYAKSFKEAQTYLSPVSILVMVPVFLTYMMDAKDIPSHYFHIPLVNISCVLKEIIVGIFNPAHISITIVWIIVYVLVAILFARFMFNREDVIFRT